VRAFHVIPPQLDASGAQARATARTPL